MVARVGQSLSVCSGLLASIAEVGEPKGLKRRMIAKWIAR